MLILLGNRQKWINKLLALIKHTINVFTEFKNTALKNGGVIPLVFYEKEPILVSSVFKGVFVFFSQEETACNTEEFQSW